MFSLLSKLAFDGIRKNKHLYYPYLLTGSVVIMMFYILLYLANSKTIAKMPAATFLAVVLPLGIIVIYIFSLIFLFYTNSLLIKQRYQEFGLYLILGMNKTNLGLLMLIENFIVYIIALGTGLLFGIAFSKMGELIIIALTKETIDFSLSISFSSLLISAIAYLLVYLLLLLSSISRINKCQPLHLLQKAKAGERSPKGNLFLALSGIAILGLAYYLALYFSSSVTAIFSFFIAVILVIIATYLLFIAGSTTLCQILRKNKGYYYKPKHFISISSLAYRMKRNGAGLASICILLTMILVMITSTSSLYFGLDDNIDSRYPGDFNYTIFYFDYHDFANDDSLIYLPKEYDSANSLKYLETSGSFCAYGINNTVNDFNANVEDYFNIGYLFAISTAEYERITGDDIELGDDECLFYQNDILNYTYSSFRTAYSKEYQVKKQLTTFIRNHAIYDYEMANGIIVINDLEEFYNANNVETEHGNTSFLKASTDVCADDLSVKEEIRANLANNASKYYLVDKDSQRSSLLGLFASMLFLGIMLSLVFVLAAILIIYYKQISEGYEDKGRFEIMQKVGLDKQMIRSSINSQMLTVFFSPLIMALVHLGFAFPFIFSMLRLFGFANLKLMIVVTGISALICAIFYLIVYYLTSNAYYQIVANEE